MPIGRTLRELILGRRAYLKKRKKKKTRDVLAPTARTKQAEKRQKAAGRSKAETKFILHGEPERTKITPRTEQVVQGLMKTGMSREEALSRTDPVKRKKALANRAKLKKKKARK